MDLFDRDSALSSGYFMLRIITGTSTVACGLAPPPTAGLLGPGSTVQSRDRQGAVKEDKAQPLKLISHSLRSPPQSRRDNSRGCNPTILNLLWLKSKSRFAKWMRRCIKEFHIATAKGVREPILLCDDCGWRTWEHGYCDLSSGCCTTEATLIIPFPISHCVKNVFIELFIERTTNHNHRTAMEC